MITRAAVGQCQCQVGETLGSEVVGEVEGDTDGVLVVGQVKGDTDGVLVIGEAVGDAVGSDEVGEFEGDTVGSEVGHVDGAVDGDVLGGAAELQVNLQMLP